MEIQMIKTTLNPSHIIIHNRIIFLITNSYIHILDLKGKIIPDIDLQNIISCHRESKTTKKLKIRIKDIQIYKKNIYILSKNGTLYYTKIGKKRIFQLNVKAEKMICKNRVFIKYSNTISKIEIKRKKVKITPVVVFPSKIQDFIICSSKIIFQSQNLIFMTRKLSLEKKYITLRNEKKNQIKEYKQILQNYAEIKTLKNLHFINMISNGTFAVLESPQNLLVFSLNSESVTIKKPATIYSYLIIDHYIFIFSDKIEIYSALSGECVRKLPITIFQGHYDPKSGLLLLKNEKIFVSNAVAIINRALLMKSKLQNTHEQKKEEDIHESTETVSKNNQKIKLQKKANWLRKFIKIPHPFASREETINQERNESIIKKTPSIHLIDLKTAIDYKLFVISKEIDSKQTFFECSKNAQKKNQILEFLFFYAQTGSKYELERKKIIEYIKSNNPEHSNQIFKFKSVIDQQILLNLSEIIYFLSIRTIFMKTEIDFLFYLCLNLKMNKYLKMILKFSIQTNLQIKLLNKMKFDLIKEENEHNSEMKDEKPVRNDHLTIINRKPKNSSIKTGISNTRNDLTKKIFKLVENDYFKSTILKYLKLNAPEKAIFFLYNSKKYKKAFNLLQKSKELKNIKDILSKLKLYEKIVSIPLLKLYYQHFPNLLILLTKSESTDNLIIFFNFVVDVLSESQSIYKLVFKMDMKCKRVLMEAIENISPSENLNILKNTIQVICNEIKEEKFNFKCDGKIVQ